jgi:hypothetical protein
MSCARKALSASELFRIFRCQRRNTIRPHKMTIRDATHMAASGSATPRLEFTASYARSRTQTLSVAFSFETQPGTADRLIVRMRWPDGGIGFARNVVQVAFYPIEIDGQLVYIMSLWSWDSQDDDRRLVLNGLFHRNYGMIADYDPGLLWPVVQADRNSHVARFSPTEVDRSVDENLWARLNWNALRVDGYVVASSNNANAMRSAAEVQDAADDAADNAEDPLADISELLATATLTDSDNIAAWRCGICLQGTQDDPHLVAAHAAHVVQEIANTETSTETSATPAPTSLVLHAFHSRCLRSWRRRKNECPTCKQPLDARPLPAVWSAGNTRLNARMGVGMRMEQNKSLVANTYLIPH